MKLKNVKIGMKVQVKKNANLIDNWYSSSTCHIGEVIRIDTTDNTCPVLVLFEDGWREWGGNKGLRKIKVNSLKESL